MTNHAHRYLYNIHVNIQRGWSQYSLYFYVSGISAIIGGFFKLAGIGAFIFTLAFFYLAGRMHKRINNVMVNETTQEA